MTSKLAVLICFLACATLLAQAADPRLTIADVEKVAGLKGIHAAVPGIGDEAFDSPPGNMQYVLYLRKGQKAASLTTYISAGKPLLTMAQLKQLGAIVASRL